nr:acetylcholine receptor subunit alpha [Crassostrea gigas]
MKPLVLLLMTLNYLGVESYTVTHQTQLHTDVLTGYDRRVRPGDGNTPTQIGLTFQAISLKEFSESEGKIALVGALMLVWMDTRLAWNPASYGGDLERTVLYIKDIWVPKLVNVNPYGPVKMLGVSEMLCEISHTGVVSVILPDLYESTCDADVSNYPFDSQTCTLQYYIPGYYVDDINLSASEPTIGMILYEENGLWKITNTSVTVATQVTNFQIMKLSLSMERRTTYYIAGLLLPILLMNAIQLLVFIIPVESGERIGYSITVLLAIAVFLTIIQDKLPESSEPNVSLLTYKLLVDMVIGCGMIFAVVIGLRFYFRTENLPVPGCLRGFARCFYLSCKRKRPTQTVVPEKEDPDTESYSVTWHDVGEAFDRMCLLLFILSLILNNAIYFAAISFK